MKEKLTKTIKSYIGKIKTTISKLEKELDEIETLINKPELPEDMGKAVHDEFNNRHLDDE